MINQKIKRKSEITKKTELLKLSVSLPLLIVQKCIIYNYNDDDDDGDGSIYKYVFLFSFLF